MTLTSLWIELRPSREKLFFVDVGSLGVFFGVVDLFGLSNYLKNSVLSC